MPPCRLERWICERGRYAEGARAVAKRPERDTGATAGCRAEGETARVVLDQDPDEALDAAEHSAMHHYRMVLGQDRRVRRLCLGQSAVASSGEQLLLFATRSEAANGSSIVRRAAGRSGLGHLGGQDQVCEDAEDGLWISNEGA